MNELLLAAERALSYGLADEAERLYRRAAVEDPASSLALVGLARVALERADDAGALDLARQALALEPANEAAARLATRLEEVLRYRDAAQAAAQPAAPKGAPRP